MQLFIDTANLEDIRKAVDSGLISGVTTNPSIIAKERRSLQQTVREILKISRDLTILAEVVSKNPAEMEREAKELAAVSDNLVIKVPANEAGIATVRRLAAAGIRTTVTLVFSLNQAVTAACAGADYVAPFVGRLDDIDSDSRRIIQSMKELLVGQKSKTRIIAASIRNPHAVSEMFLAGADIVTAPYTVLSQLLKHPLTDAGLAKFELDWAAASSPAVN